MPKRKLAHIINPVAACEKSELSFAQPITFESMRIARQFARELVDVQLFSAHFPEDRSVVPADFVHTAELERSVLDFGSFHRPRKLPLIADILDRLYQAADAEYLIYTNVDIGLQPHFYLAVNRLIDQGFDAFVVNRRTVAGHYRQVSELPLIYADIGKKHEGYDCFVFKRAAYPAYRLGAICLGIPRVGRALLWNLYAHARCFREFRRLHLTFHIGPGNDGAWQGAALADYREHNIREALKVLQQIETAYGPLPEALTSPFWENIGKTGASKTNNGAELTESDA